MNDVTMPKLTHSLAVAALKQYAIVLDAMFKSATSDASRRTFDLQRRSIVDLARMVEDCASPARAAPGETR